MLVRPRRPLDVLTISALDLFASALGVFILTALILMPYYLREPSLRAELAGESAELAAGGAALDEARRRAAEMAEQRAEEEAALAAAETRLAGLESEVRSLATQVANLPTPQPAPEPAPRPAPDPRPGTLSISELDLVFVMDTTGSMREELRDVQSNLLGMIRVLHRLSPSLAVGFVAYKDRTDPYLTKVFPLSPMNTGNMNRLLDFVRGLSAEGGGDPPEPVDEALAAAVGLAWRTDALGHIIAIGDAPAHAQNQSRSFGMARDFVRGAGSKPRRVSSIVTGRARPSVDYFSRLAEAGGGDLMMHSGQMMESVLLAVLQ